MRKAKLSACWKRVRENRVFSSEVDAGSREENTAKQGIVFLSEVDAGSREENTIKRGALAVGSLILALPLAACSSAAPPPVAAAPVAVVVPEPPAPGVVGVSVGRELDEKDRATAIAAQQAAVTSGSRKAWKGEHGAYGFIIPGPENGGGGCRDYSHKIFINGRPQEGKGQACKSGENWRVTS